MQTDQLGRELVNAALHGLPTSDLEPASCDPAFKTKSPLFGR
jgi:hypothetical protein